MAYLVLAGSLGVFWLFVFVLRRWTASAVSFEFLLIPLATIPFSALLTGEVITPLMLVGGAIILAGVYLGALAPDPTAATSERAKRERYAAATVRLTSATASGTPPVQAGPCPGSSQAASTPLNRSNDSTAWAGSAVNGATCGPC